MRQLNRWVPSSEWAAMVAPQYDYDGESALLDEIRCGGIIGMDRGSAGVLAGSSTGYSRNSDHWKVRVLPDNIPEWLSPGKPGRLKSRALSHYNPLPPAPTQQKVDRPKCIPPNRDEFRERWKQQLDEAAAVVAKQAKLEADFAARMNKPPEPHETWYLDQLALFNKLRAEHGK